MTVLFASVAPRSWVKMIEVGSHPRREASDHLALCNCSRERSPNQWLLAGVAKTLERGEAGHRGQMPFEHGGARTAGNG